MIYDKIRTICLSVLNRRVKAGLLLVATFCFLNSYSQTFWTENFNNGCSSLCLATSYTGTNGAWTMTNNGASTACGSPTTPNEWYVSCSENGNTVGSCGIGCGNNATLHVSNISSSPSASIFCPSGDCSAQYDAGGYCGLLSLPTSTETDKRVESPTINCTGYTTITIDFKYMENGDGTNDDATLWYFDGATWSQIDPIAKSSNGGCSGRGRWTAFSALLPASANNNSNVKIGFRWVNDDDGNGTDPSFAVDDVQLSVPIGAPPVAAFIANNYTICAGQCVDFADASTGSPTSWSWTFPGGSIASSTTQSPTNICYATAGTYTATLTVTNANGSSTISQTISVNSLPVANTGADATICSGNSATLTASGGGNYVWSPGGQTSPSIVVSPTGNTTYSATVTNSCGSSTDSVNVVVTSGFPASISANTTICSGASTILTASGGTNYLWSNSAITPSITVSPTATTTYSVIITNASGCSQTQSVTVTTTPGPTITANATPVIIAAGDSSQLTATGGGTYQWSPATGLSCDTCANPIAKPSQTTTYCVLVTDGGGCTSSACVTIEMDCDTIIYIPNAFSPNGDTENDLECVMGTCIETFYFAIYDRWGGLMFESTDPLKCWDGIFDGKLLNTAVFLYYMEATTTSGVQIIKKGNVSLVR